MNTLEEMKIEYEAAKEDHKNSKTRTARLGINDALYKLKKKIDDEENRINRNLKIITIGNIKFEMPENFNWYSPEKQTLIVENDVLYVMDLRKNINNDGSYHWHHYVWIPQTDIKYAKLCVRTLGGDYHGDRYFISVSYYKHPADPHSYMEKDLNPFNRTYLPHVEYILKKLGLLEKVRSNKR